MLDDKQCIALIGHPVEKLHQTADIVEMQPVSRLIQNNRLRIAEHCLCQTDSLFITFGKVVNQTLPDILQLRGFDRLFDLRCSFLSRNAL